MLKDELADADERDKPELLAKLSKAEGEKASIEEKARREAFTFRKDLNQLKAQVSQPLPQQDPKIMEQHKAIIEGYKNYNAVAVTIGDKKVNVELDANDINTIQGILAGTQVMKEKAEYDETYKFISKAIAFDKAVEAAHKEGLAKGALNLIKDQKNITITPAGSDPAIGEETAAAKSIKSLLGSGMRL